MKDKEKIEDNATRSSLLGSVIVHYKWDNEKKYREFKKLRLGGNTETDHDLKLKYDENPFENESVLIYFEQIVDNSVEEKKDIIKNLLQSEGWQWNPEQQIDFDKEINKIIKA